MANSTPGSFFGTSGLQDLGIHVVRKWGDDDPYVSGKKIKYTMYSSKNASTKFNIYAPVKLTQLEPGEANFNSTSDYNSSQFQGETKIAIYKIEEDAGVFKKGWYIILAGLNGNNLASSINNNYNKGNLIGTTKSNYVKISIHKPQGTTGRRAAAAPTLVAQDPTPFLEASEGTNASSTTNIAATGTSGGDASTSPGGDTTDIGSIAKAAAFSTFFQMPGMFDYFESTQLYGQKSLLNDQPLMPFIEQLTSACLRHFMSTPSGDFFAFYPDYFGGLGKNPYWLIEDIEVINGSIELSDDQLATHVYVVGDIVGPPSGAFGSSTIDQMDRMQTGGVVTIFNAFMADFLNGTDTPRGGNNAGKATLANKADAISFLKKYGARPFYEEQPAVRAPIYESFLAYQKFCLKWSEQFKTQFQFTFMPELFPGGIVAFPEHGLQCYVNSVTHNCSYETGFTTTAELSAPAAYKGDGGAIDPDKAWVHAGMIRSWPETDAVGSFSQATDTDPAKPEEGNSGN